MEKLIGILVFLIVSLTLFIIGYNCIFNTRNIVNKFASLVYKENSILYELATSNTNIKWVKISGFGIIFFSLLLFSLVVYRICQAYFF
ncbi:hypothetical protein CHRYSEOSP005_23920 [Chryseobacterium sp. Alg-005]